MSFFSITRHRQRIDLVFERADGLPFESEQLRSDLSRYLCILVAGFLERSVQTMYLEYAKSSASPKVVSYLEKQLRWSINFNMDKLLGLVSSFGDDWTQELKDHKDFDQFKAAIDSVYANRNRIAHGDDVGVSYVVMKEYYAAVSKLVDLLVEQCGR